MDHVTSRFADSLRGTRDRKRDEERAAREEREKRRETRERERQLAAYTYKAMERVSRTSVYLGRVCATTYQLESARLVRKCSWKGFLLSGLERNVSGDSTTADRPREFCRSPTSGRVESRRVAWRRVTWRRVVSRRVGSRRVGTNPPSLSWSLLFLTRACSVSASDPSLRLPMSGRFYLLIASTDKWIG